LRITRTKSMPNPRPATEESEEDDLNRFENIYIF
jgi:hypothetical protein